MQRINLVEPYQLPTIVPNQSQQSQISGAGKTTCDRKDDYKNSSIIDIDCKCLKGDTFTNYTKDLGCSDEISLNRKPEKGILMRTNAIKTLSYYYVYLS